MTLGLMLQESADSVRALIDRNSTSFGVYDRYGIGMALIGMCVVFGALFLLYIMFANIVKIINKTFTHTQKTAADDTKKTVKPSNLTGEVNAAIATAIFLYNNEMHDQENAILTIQRIQRTYSPWSSKIYSLRKNPRQ
jgi:Na+-transporting methylmalonyl-CoA/oxaloacetate decarboxylase gamma subunit